MDWAHPFDLYRLFPEPAQYACSSEGCWQQSRSAIARGWSITVGAKMSVDAETVRRIAHLARIAVCEVELEHLRGVLSAMLAFVEPLADVHIANAAPVPTVRAI